MARLESVAVGGYYPTPPHVVDLISKMLVQEDQKQYHTYRLCDPCAGDGAAIIRLGESFANVDYYTCELEQERHKQLTESMQKINYANGRQALHGDAFQIEFTKGIGVLYLNPPYDTDPVHGRLEERFLGRFTGVLENGGLLILVVPHYALAASARTLATEYDKLSCYRFPKGDFEAYQQVVLFAHKTERRLEPDPKILGKVQKWAQSATMPVLGQDMQEFSFPHSYMSSNSWWIREFDLMGLVRKAKPWRQTTKTGDTLPVPHILPEVPVKDLMFRTFQLATAPRPAHIAAGIASGLFNGRRVSSKTPGLPDLLVKGVFDREYVTIEEKENRDGEVTSVVQVQQPKLVTTILNLKTKKYSTLKPSGKSSELAVESIEDLLGHYGPSLIEVMNQQCPVFYSPQRDADSLPLASSPRSLFTAQKNASKAILKLLGGVNASRQARRYRASILLGEIGSGKTSVALTVGHTMGNRMLVLCPPHLLDSWTDETRAVVPDAEIRILQSVSDVTNLQDVPKDKFLVAILSRETAKLGHGWSAVSGFCPKCGAALPKEDLAKKRARCPTECLQARDGFARAAQDLALKMAFCAPNNHRVYHVLQSRALRRHLERLSDRDPATLRKWAGFDPHWVNLLLMECSKQSLANEEWAHLFGRLMLAHYNPGQIAYWVRTLLANQDNWVYRDIAKDLTLLLTPDSDLQKELRNLLSKDHWSYRPEYARHDIEQVQKEDGHRTRLGVVKWEGNRLTLGDCEPESLELADAILGSLSYVGKFERQEPCEEHLYQAVPEPRRYPLSNYIARRMPDFFDFLVLDEGHEYATDGSAQERSAHRLTALGIPTLLMTGSIMNGYAESLFTNMWALSREFREEFARDERQRYIDRYGYRKRVLTDRDRETGDVVEFGAVTDRVQRSERITGDAPGILPLFLFRHLLRISVTLHKADLALELPKCHQIRSEIKADSDLLSSYKALQQSLITRIRKDQFREGYAGKLFGALAELPSYLDRATLDTGNQDDGSYEIRYPASLKSELVARGESFSSERLSAKEQWMIDTVRAELAEGRNVMVFSWHVALLPRLARLIKQELDEEAPILYADKVPTRKRQEWINRNVVRKNRRVMIANPVCIQTGLNNLVHFATEIWMENPACNPTIYRQAIGRIDRIGQKLETRIYTPIYADTLQIQLYDLLLRKVAVAVSTDGLDPESMLIAAGASEDGYLSGLSIGKQLWAMLQAA